MRWKIVLPVLMSAVSVTLMLVAEKQQPMLFKMGSGYEVPARVLNSVLNGPGDFLGDLPYLLIPRLNSLRMPDSIEQALNYDGDKLWAIAGFWFLVGWAIDRRGKGRALDQFHPTLAAVLFTFAAFVCGLLAYGRSRQFLCPGPNESCWDQIPISLRPTLRLVADHPLRTTYSIYLCQTLWFCMLSLYFFKRAFTAAIRDKRTESQDS